MAITIRATSRIANVLSPKQLQALMTEFRQLKESTNRPAIFGRDTPFNRPSSVVFAGLQHVHVHPNFLTNEPINSFSNRLPTWNLKAVQMNQTSDTWLIYCQGWRDPNNYLLIAFWENDAHQQAKRTTLMLALAEEAEKFRKNY
jgi:Toxin YafO, type II toxin-antitoxin system